MFILGITYLVLWIWQIFNAKKLAKKFNELVRTNGGKEPWWKSKSDFFYKMTATSYGGNCDKCGAIKHEVWIEVSTNQIVMNLRGRFDV